MPVWCGGSYRANIQLSKYKWLVSSHWIFPLAFPSKFNGKYLRTTQIAFERVYFFRRIFVLKENHQWHSPVHWLECRMVGACWKKSGECAKKKDKINELIATRWNVSKRREWGINWKWNFPWKTSIYCLQFQCTQNIEIRYQASWSKAVVFSLF